MTNITLSWLEMVNAANVGVARRLTSMKRGLDAHKHAAVSNFQTDIEGAIAEACFAKFMGMHWDCSCNTFKAPDVGCWQVRSTAAPWGHLIVRPNDADYERVALLITQGFGARVVGWMLVADAKASRYWRADCESWWIPQRDLEPFMEVQA